MVRLTVHFYLDQAKTTEVPLPPEAGATNEFLIERLEKITLGGSIEVPIQTLKETKWTGITGLVGRLSASVRSCWQMICLSQSDQGGSRRNLFDPVLLEDCQLAPFASGEFRSRQNPTVLVRLYPPDERFAKLITKQWKAYAAVDGEVSIASAISITYPDVRGPAASGKLMLSQMHLKPGPHQLSVIFEAPGDGRAKHRIPLNTEFSVAP